MIALLARIFMKNEADATPAEERQAYGTLCSAAGIALNLLLSAGKFFAGTVSGSIAINTYVCISIACVNIFCTS